MKTAVMFPGQGVQHPRMAGPVLHDRPDLARALERALGPRPFRRLAEGTRVVQPAVFCASVVSWLALRRAGVTADVYAGHSLGEIAALVAAEAIDAEQGLEIVVARGRLTAQAAAGDAGGGMLVVMQGDLATVQGIAERCEVVVANDNSPRQIVLSGSRAALRRAEDESRRLGLQIAELDVEGAFHSQAMRAAGADFRALLDGVAFRAPQVPVYSGVSAEPFEDIPRELTASLTSMVRWREVLLNLHRDGVRTFVDAGPDKVLAGLARRTLAGVEVLTAADVGAVAA
jgi:[acyl-carrier-protein] S-malonyltransferase